jgi:riboflavin synthase
MFTGIVYGSFRIESLEMKTGLMTITVLFDEIFLQDLKIGASVALDGVCLTVTEILENSVRFDIMIETLRLTTLQFLKVGSLVNVERSCRLGEEIGGHLCSGHVSGMVSIVRVEEPENNKSVTVKIAPEWMRYVVNKGFITLDGCSLTVVNPNREDSTFEVWLIPETLKRTSLGRKGVGDVLNIEFDPMTQYIVETVERIMSPDIN